MCECVGHMKVAFSLVIFLSLFLFSVDILKSCFTSIGVSICRFLHKSCTRLFLKFHSGKLAVVLFDTQQPVNFDRSRFQCKAIVLNSTSKRKAKEKEKQQKKKNENKNKTNKEFLRSIIVGHCTHTQTSHNADAFKSINSNGQTTCDQTEKYKMKSKRKRQPNGKHINLENCVARISRRFFFTSSYCFYR